PKKSQFTVRENSGLVYKVNQVLTSLYDGMRTDGKLTEQQKQLALNTRIPIIAYVKDVALLNAGSGFTNNLAEYLSLDFAISYVEGLIDVVSLAGANSFTSEHESEVFKENLRTVREKLSQNLAKVQIQQDAYLSAVKQLETLRKQLSHDLTNKIGFGE
ncbi:conjugal transfer protein TraH, partial [Glaesserella parasuis]|nr:conjugal transfer protein TraH [Glaesserella parasuis]